MNTTGTAAIKLAELNPTVVLRKYADPISEARIITLDEAREIAKEYPSLICCEARRISTDEMNDIIGRWVDDELPKPVGGYETSEAEDAAVAARGRRFEEIINMPEPEFSALHAEKECGYITQNPDGSYTARE